MANNEPQVDVNRVLTKMQNKLAESMTTIAILEARLEQMQESQEDADQPVE